MIVWLKFLKTINEQKKLLNINRFLALNKKRPLKRIKMESIYTVELLPICYIYFLS